MYLLWCNFLTFKSNNNDNIIKYIECCVITRVIKYIINYVSTKTGIKLSSQKFDSWKARVEFLRHSTCFAPYVVVALVC